MRERASAVASSVVAAAVLLASCGGPTATNGSNAADADEQTSPTAPATPVAAVSPALAPMPDPDHDARPDKVKLEDFAAHLDAAGSALAAADAAVVQQARAALSAGSQPDARAALATYQSALATPLPRAPRLDGCFARADPDAGKALATLKAMVADRSGKVAALAGGGDAPLSLASFGPIATDAADPAPAAALKTSLEAIRATATSCAARQSVAAGTPSRRAAAAAAETPAVGPVTAKPTLGTTQHVVLLPPGSASPPAQKKPSFWDQVRHAFK